MRKTDYLTLRPDLPANFNLWTTYWKPCSNIPYRILDPSVEYVYVVITDDKPPVDVITILRNILNLEEKLNLKTKTEKL